jgi:hypothetical protein
MKHLVGKVLTKKVPFMGDEVEIRKMSVSEVMQIQSLTKSATKSKDETAQLSLLQEVIKIAVIDANELSKEDFDSFPLGELNDLSNSILEYSGLSGGSEGN